MKLTVICVRFGTLYGIEYVEKLRNMVSRNLTIPYEFVCLTDDPTPIDNVRLIVEANAGYKRGWWHKIHMFNPNLPVDGYLLYFDLDVIIHDNIDQLVKPGFFGIRDFNRKFNPNYRYLNSSVMLWEHGSQSIIWDEFIRQPLESHRMVGDQDYIWNLCKSRIQFWPDNWIQSYKWEIRDKSELTLLNGKRQFLSRKDDVIIPYGCCIIVFHGDPKPSEIKDKFILENWK